MSGQIDQQMERQLNKQPSRRETRVVYRSEERKIQILSLRQLLIVSWLARHVSMTRSRESPPPEDFETEFGNPLRLPRTYVSLRATDPVHRRADNRHVTIHQRSAALLKELAQRVLYLALPKTNLHPKTVGYERYGAVGSGGITDKVTSVPSRVAGVWRRLSPRELYVSLQERAKLVRTQWLHASSSP